MADRIMTISELGTLATAAAQRGDDRAADVLRDAIRLLVSDAGTVEKDERRRQRDRERKPGRPSIPRNSTDSTEIVESLEGFPTPLPKTLTAESRDSARDPLDEVAKISEAALAYIDLLRGQMGDTLFPDADAFVRRRPMKRWEPWLREMLSLLTGGKATAADLAQVCRDDAALDRPIGSPFGLRSFVGNAVRERLNRSTDTNGSAPRPGIGGRAYLTTLDAIKDM